MDISLFKELAILEERIKEDSKRREEILSEISTIISEGEKIVGNWYVKGHDYLYIACVIDRCYWGYHGPLKSIRINPLEFTCDRDFINFKDLDGFELVTNKELLSFLELISSPLYMKPDLLDAGGNKYLKMNLVQNYNWQHIH
ncbi:MAG: hypothetical protein [Bacteriophage sp.]|jgi:hypothetical protein|nr:MAG: hypothetical protein [Bacteriophage sp.]